jgi:hypothetical protein
MKKEKNDSVSSACSVVTFVVLGSVCGVPLRRVSRYAGMDVSLLYKYLIPSIALRLKRLSCCCVNSKSACQKC